MQTIMVNATVKRKPVESKYCTVKLCLRIAQSKYFDRFISVAVAINMVVLCIEYYGSPYWYRTMLEIFNVVFVVLFAFEALIKLIGFGVWLYFSDSQNKFDFFLVLVSIIGVVE